MDERSQAFGQQSFRAEQFGQQYGARYGSQSFANQAGQYAQYGQYGQHGLTSQAGQQQFGQSGHQQYGATAQSYNPQQHYTSQWQQQPAGAGYQGSQFSNQFSSQAQPGYQFSNQAQQGYQYSNQAQQYGERAWESQAGQRFGASQHEQYGATASSYDPQQHYSSQWQSYSQQPAGQSFANQAQYGQQASAGRAGQFGQSGHEQYGATASSYDPQQHYSSQWQSYGQEARAESSFSNRAGQFGQQQAYAGQSFSNQAGQFGQFGQQAYGGQSFANQAGQYGQYGLASQAGQQFGQSSHQQYGATAQSYNPQEHYSSRWQPGMSGEQAGGAFRS